MSNYQETIESVEKTKWRRAYEIVLANPHQGLPSATIKEEDLTTIGDSTYREIVGAFSTPLEDPAMVVPFIDANYNQILDADGKPIEGQSFSVQQFVFQLTCLYIHLAERYHNPPVVVEPPPPEDLPPEEPPPEDPAP